MLSELRDWQVTRQNPSRVYLEHVSGGEAMVPTELWEELTRLRRFEEAARGLKLSHRKPGYLINHLEGCAALDADSLCDCGMAELFLLLVEPDKSENPS